jgi:hypothetical protein
MSIFGKIEELEEKGMWQSALFQLNRKLEISPSKQTAIRLLFVCWYALIEWGCLEFNEEAESEIFETQLKAATGFLLKNHPNDPEVNFYLGYMISLSAWFFSEKVGEWEEKARQMLSYAKEEEPNNAIYQMVYFGNIKADDEKYAYWCKQAKPLVKELYSGKGEFNLYFRQVLTR